MDTNDVIDESEIGTVDLDAEHTWNTFWKEIVTQGDGRASLAKVKRELLDFRVCMREVTRVYDELTGGMFTKPTTQAQYILDAVAERQREEILEAVKEARSELEQEINQAFDRLKKAKINLNDATIEQRMALESYQIEAAFRMVEKHTREIAMAELEIDRLRLIVQARKA